MRIGAGGASLAFEGSSSLATLGNWGFGGDVP